MKTNLGNQLLETMKEWFELSMIKGAELPLITDKTVYGNEFYKVKMKRYFQAGILSLKVKKGKNFDKLEFQIIYDSFMESIGVYYNTKPKKKSSDRKGSFNIDKTNMETPNSLRSVIEDVIAVLNGDIKSSYSSFVTSIQVTNRPYNPNKMKEFYTKKKGFIIKMMELLSNKKEKMSFIYNKPLNPAGYHLDNLFFDNTIDEIDGGIMYTAKKFGTKKSDDKSIRNYLGFEIGAYRFIITNSTVLFKNDDKEKGMLPKTGVIKIIINNIHTINLGVNERYYEDEFQAAYGDICATLAVMNIIEDLGDISEYNESKYSIKGDLKDPENNLFKNLYTKLSKVKVPKYVHNIDQNEKVGYVNYGLDKDFDVKNFHMDKYRLKADIEYLQHTINIDLELIDYYITKRKDSFVIKRNDDTLLIAMNVFKKNGSGGYRYFISDKADMDNINKILNDLPLIIDRVKSGLLAKDDLIFYLQRNVADDDEI